MRKYLIYIMITCFLFMNCAPVEFIAAKPKPLNLAKADVYDIQSELAKISKPKRIVRRYAKFNEDKTQLVFVDDPKEADVFILVPTQYGKINQLKELAITYKSIIIKQEKLINLKNETINELQKILQLTERERDVAISAWENSENAYRQEKAEHKRDNFVNRATMYIITVGSIVLLAVGL